MARQVFPGWSYQRLAEEHGLELCAGPALACDRRISQVRHDHGYADRYGRIHWSKSSMRKRGVRRFLMLVAVVKLKHHRKDLPTYLRIFECDRWAYHEAIRLLHMKFPARFSETDQKEVMRLLDIEQRRSRKVQRFRRQNERLYRWLLTYRNRQKENIHESDDYAPKP